MTRRLRTASACLCLLVFAQGCASTTIIRSYPSGAQVLIEGAFRGLTPYVHTDSKLAWSTLQITLRAPGYQELNVALSRGDKFAVGPFIGGLLIWPILLWMMEYRPDYVFQLLPYGAQAPASSGTVGAGPVAPAPVAPAPVAPAPVVPGPVSLAPLQLPPVTVPAREEAPDMVWRALQGRAVNITRNDGSVVSGTLSAFAPTTVTVMLPTGAPLTIERASVAYVRGQ